MSGESYRSSLALISDALRQIGEDRDCVARFNLSGNGGGTLEAANNLDVSQAAFYSWTDIDGLVSCFGKLLNDPGPAAVDAAWKPSLGDMVRHRASGDIGVVVDRADTLRHGMCIVSFGPGQCGYTDNVELEPCDPPPVAKS